MNHLRSNSKPSGNSKLLCPSALLLQSHFHNNPSAPFQFRQRCLIHSLIKLDLFVLLPSLDQPIKNKCINTPKGDEIYKSECIKGE